MAAPHNWIGLFGAYLSDLLLQALGLTAFLLPLWLGGVGWTWMRSRPGGSPILRWMGTLLALAFLPAVFGLLPWHWRWLHVVPVEGVVGRLMAGLLVVYLNLQGAWLVAAALAAAGLYFASAISFWVDSRKPCRALGTVRAMADRWRELREERAELRGASRRLCASEGEAADPVFAVRCRSQPERIGRRGDSGAPAQPFSRVLPPQARAANRIPRRDSRLPARRTGCRASRRTSAIEAANPRLRRAGPASGSAAKPAPAAQRRRPQQRRLRRRRLRRSQPAAMSDPCSAAAAAAPSSHAANARRERPAPAPRRRSTPAKSPFTTAPMPKCAPSPWRPRM